MVLIFLLISLKQSMSLLRFDLISVIVIRKVTISDYFLGWMDWSNGNILKHF